MINNAPRQSEEVLLPELSFHGQKRNRQRTKVTDAEILELIEQNSHIILGTYTDYTYILLYVPIEDTCKIIILDNDLTVVVSIWYDTYTLPRGVKKVSHRRKSKARIQHFDANTFK